MVTQPTEADLAARVVAYFHDNQWDIFQEVQLRQSRGRADIVVRQGAIVGVIECKLALGLPVMEQAFEWKGYAHFVWVATRNRHPGRLVYKILEDSGIGWLSLYSANDDVRENSKPTFLRKPPLLDLLAAALTDERKSFGVAGTNGGHWTPFKSTCYELARIAREEPGILLKDALEKFKHHYSSTKSAMCNLPEWIDKGKVPGVGFDRSDGRLRLVLKETP